MNKKNKNTPPAKNKKAPLTYAIIPEFEQEIREYVNGIRNQTGLPASRVVTNLLLDAVRQAKKICSANSENSEM